jgi:hypothetical protein
MKNEIKLTTKELAEEIEKGRKKISIGSKYTHYKNPSHKYTVLDLAIQEATNKVCVIYKADYVTGITFIRDLDVWLSKPTINGKKVNRFTKVT